MRAADFYVCSVCGGGGAGDSNFCGGIYVFGGGADGLSLDAVLCVGVFYFCGGVDFVVAVFAVGDADGVGGGNGAWVVSADGAENCERFDGGAENSLCDTAGVFVFDDGCGVGGGDVAGDYV